LAGELEMEHSEVFFQDLEQSSLRLDAEYYRPYFLEIEKTLKGKNWDFLSNLRISIKSFGAYSLCNQVNYQESGIPFLRCKDIKKGYIDFSNVLFIDDKTNKLLSKSQVFPNTVLFTMSGTVGNSAIATEDLDYPINSNQDIAKIITNEKISPYTLSIFLQSKFGKGQTDRLPIGSVQQHIFLWQLDRLLIPLFSEKFEKLLEKAYKLALKFQKSSISQINEAQNSLLLELGLIDWKPQHQLSFIKDFSDTEDVKRLDAEYFQPKYDQIITAVKTYLNGWDKLNNIVFLKKCIEVGSEEYQNEGIPFIRVSNLSPLEITEEKYISETLYSKLTPQENDVVSFLDSKNLQPKKGEILLSKDATPGIAYFIDDDPKKMIPSGGILRLKIKNYDIHPEYLTLVLNSVIVQEQVNRDVGGSVILHWRTDQIRDTIIPILPDEIQRKICSNVQSSKKFRNDSNKLIDSAIIAVEMAIKQDDEIAEKWLAERIAEIIGDE